MWSTPVALDRHIRSLARELALRELAIGSAALQLFEADGWRRLGYATATQYARERAGMSYSALKAHVTLARRALREPVLHDAICTGRIGSEAARLVGRVAVAKTVQAWIARAQERTIKHLHEEVKATELIGRLVERGDLEPPDDEAMNMVAAVEAAVLSGQVYRAADEEVQGGSVFAREQAGVDESPMSAHEQEDAVPPRRGAGKTCLRLRVSEETYRQYRALERDYLQHTAHPIGFLGFLCLAVWDSWHAGLGRKVAYGDIYARDRYRCSSPVCTRGDVTPHHLRFRSQGGDDAPENVTSLCVWCHLEGVHGGRIRALPPAPEVRWVLGERAILAVHGRRKQELDRAA